MTSALNMDNPQKRRVHWSFWAIGAISFIWNALGAVNFFVQMNPEILEAYRESERAIVEGRPTWATFMFGLAVFAGTLGSIALLLRRRVALALFVMSLVGVAGTTVHSLSVGIQFSAGEIVGIILMPLLVPAFLIWYSRVSGRRGWLR